ncbi:SDR family oxidoreductase [Acetobacteraceae bacterium H6797]|nr:SDR family oxidoreductase [Acetobacteraceae bacterium H6797]
MSGRLAGKVAWITGAGTGIGRAIAIAFAAEGARLFLTGRRRGPLEETAGLLGEAPAVVLPADLTDAAQVQAAAEMVGPCDILVNNAGMNITKRHWHQLTPESVKALVDANLTAPFLTSLAVVPSMAKRGDGLIIQIASMAGKNVSTLSGVGYTAAKTGYVALSQTINVEHGIHGVRSTAICPGEVATPILDQRPVPPTPEERARMLQPEDIAAAALFVATLPPRMLVNEMLVNPTWNRSLLSAAQKVEAL